MPADLDSAVDAIDPDEPLFPVAKAFEMVTGQRPSPATCWRLHRKRGLRTVKYLGKRMITLRAVREFLEPTSPADQVKLAPAPRTTRAKEAAIALAERRLAEMGV